MMNPCTDAPPDPQVTSEVSAPPEPDDDATDEATDGSTEGESDSSGHSGPSMVIIAASAGGGAVALVLVCICVCACRKRSCAIVPRRSSRPEVRDRPFITHVIVTIVSPYSSSAHSIIIHYR